MVNKIFDKYPEFSSGVKVQAKGEDFNNTYSYLLVASVAAAQNAYQILKQTNSYDNIDFIVVDEFTDADGTKNTVSQGTEDPTLVDTDSTVFSTSSSSYQLAYTSPALNRQIKKVVVGISMSLSRTSSKKVVFNYSDSTNEEVIITDSPSGTSINNYTYINPLSSKEVQTIEIYISTTDSTISYKNSTTTAFIVGSLSTSVFNTNYYECKGGAGSYENSSVLINLNTPALDGTEKAVTIYTDCVHTANTSMGVKVGDGTSQTAEVTMKNNATVIDITALSAGNIEYEFIERTSDVSETPQFMGYGSVIQRDIE